MRETLHVVSGEAAARVLGKALRRAGRGDAIAAFPDDLGLGPIDPPAPLQRIAWFEDVLGVAADQWEGLSEATAAFWQMALLPETRRLLWVSRDCVPDYTAFLEWVWQLGDLPYDVVDLSAFSLRALDARQAAAYWDRAAPLTASERRRYRALWARLRQENAPVRRLTDAGLVSAPISCWDELLLSCVAASWRKAARVIGDAMVKAGDERAFQRGELLLGARLRALAAAGRIEAAGNLRRIRYSEVRLPSGT